MNKEVCKKFQELRDLLPDYLNAKFSYEFTNGKAFEEYCTGYKCDDDTGKINAGCLYLFDAFFKNSANFVSVAKSNINIVEYIMIWLSYMLNFIRTDENESIYPFYNYIICSDEKYNDKINDVNAYENYKDLIDKKENLMSISIIDMSNFYDAFILLCDMYIEHEKNPSCDNYLNNAKKFVEMYDELNEDYYNGEGSPYNQLLSTLSDDYCNLKKKYNSLGCNNSPSLPTYSRKFVIKRTLIPIAFMIVALSIFLGIEYKYSSLGFRKRSQKQCLREKIKNIMKKMIH
ncbi:PIR protein [Plasmodium yoelii]|uniref:PIR protein n=2 Tax=Plasmodium yoelii TaxID=5861 RepID=A0AAF0B3A4_PLAYO|nr:PIR protein [Plasmodium yoelii]XP_034493418.1 PIR protein [Plasmodium yoelii]WBY55829.1 PIR protein [Plasmodium yoelii yoelii]WBY55847.1 PIR protein [Plasmodium yoelii yoelii]VTZ75030.1 PIR protein [Plasmodium yoelii]VTZ75064.1 PIR protein [Plasmodium yoelii]|eukprot:XP_034493404.1 PIR protein [Plasmodium yoelii]